MRPGESGRRGELHVERALVWCHVIGVATYLPLFIVLTLRPDWLGLDVHSVVETIWRFHLGFALLGLVVTVLVFRDLYLRSFPRENAKLTRALPILALPIPCYFIVVFKHAFRPRTKGAS